MPLTISPLHTPSMLSESQDEFRVVRFLVDADGLVEDLEGRHAATFLNSHPDLIKFAQALIGSGRDLVRFVSIDENKAWFGVRIELLSAVNAEQQSIVIARKIAPPFALTLRELDVLTLMSGGLGNHEIASCLETSLRTITTHVERILVKLGQTSRTGAATLATDLGILRLPTPGGGRNLIPLTAGLVDRKPGFPTPASNNLAPAIQRRPILIGTPLSTHGLASADAIEMLNGARLAVDEINRRGGVSGRRLELKIAECDVGDENDILSAVKTLIDSEVEAITSGYSCAEDKVQDMVADYGAPYLHCATMEAMVDRVRQDRWRLRNVFQLCPSDINYGPRFIQFLSTLEKSRKWTPHSRRVVVIQPRWSRMDIGFINLERLALKAGFKIDLMEDLPIRGIDWSEVMDKLHKSDPAAVFLAYYFPEENISFLQHFLANPPNALVYTLYGPSIPVYREQLGQSADGVVWATTTGRYSDHLAMGFVERYERMHGKRPGHSHAGLAYDRINILATAWTRVNNPRAFDKVIPELRSVVHRGVNGAYSFDNDGQCAQSYPDTSVDPSISQAHLIFQIQQGQQRILSPAPYGDFSFILPPWLQKRR